MAGISFCCPSCGHAYQFAAHMGGKRGRCKACQEVFRIPMESAPPTGPAVSSSSPASPKAAPSPGPDKIVFNCPTCGHGYRLAAKLAGKQGRCTACRGVFTIPLKSPSSGLATDARGSEPMAWGRAPSPPLPDPEPTNRKRAPVRSESPAPAAPRSVPRASRKPDRGIVSAVPIPDDTDDDPEWWDLDSSESIPATMARSGRGTAAAVASAPASAARAARVTAGPQGPPAATVQPQRPKWVLYAGISAGGIVGVIIFAVMINLVSGSRGPQPNPVADQPTPEAAPAPAPVAEVSAPGPDTGSSTIVGAPEAHRAAIDALVLAYNEIADGYAQIHDAASIPRGEGRIARGVDQLKAAAERGRSLPPLQADEHAVLTGSKGPSLLQAVDRVIEQLRRLKATPGIKSEFDRVIDAYTGARQAIDREMQGPATGPGPAQPPNFGRPPAPFPPRSIPPGPPRRLRGRR